MAIPKLSSSPTKHAIDIYTDGGYFSKKDIGGWAFVIYQNNQECWRLSGRKRNTSSLEMELYAALQSLIQLQENAKPPSESTQFNITLHTDSRILIEGLQQKYTKWCADNWKVKSGKAVVYKELWQALFELISTQQVTLKWVKAHNGNSGNTLADDLARQAALAS